MDFASTDRLKSFCDRDLVPSERLATRIIVTSIAIVSFVLMLSYASPEFFWDEADYVAQTINSWSSLWAGFNYDRHGHGPLGRCRLTL